MIILGKIILIDKNKNKIGISKWLKQILIEVLLLPYVTYIKIQIKDVF